MQHGYFPCLGLLSGLFPIFCWTQYGRNDKIIVTSFWLNHGLILFLRHSVYLIYSFQPIAAEGERGGEVEGVSKGRGWLFMIFSTADSSCLLSLDCREAALKRSWMISLEATDVHSLINLQFTQPTHNVFFFPTPFLLDG